MVELGEHHGPRHPDGCALGPKHAGGPIDGLGRRYDEQRAVRRPQAGAEVANEVGVPRRVEQVDLDAFVRERSQRQADRSLLAQLGLVVVADRGPVLDPAGPMDRAGGDQKGLNQGCLA